MVVVVVALVLGRLAYDCPDARAGRSADKSALQATAKDCAERRAASRADKRTFARSNATLFGLLVVIVMVGAIMLAVVVASLRAVTHAVVVGAIVVLLPERGNNADCEEERSDENRFFERAHLRLDAEFWDDGLLHLTWQSSPMGLSSLCS